MATAMTSEVTSESAGLKFPRVFSDGRRDPFDSIPWATRTATIRAGDGTVIFEQSGVVVPESWSQTATNVVASKYFYGDLTGGNGSPADGRREHSAGQLIGRVVDTVAAWGQAGGTFATSDDCAAFRDDLAWLCLHQHGAFNSPVWFNVGLRRAYGIGGPANGYRWAAEGGRAVAAADAYETPICSACFIQGVADDMGSIMALATSEAMLFKYGSGTGSCLSALRSEREKLSGGGKPSGPVSFMRIYDSIAATIKSGGKTRRAAKMQILRCDHPDILKFVRCKAVEEGKAAALVRAGYSGGMDGEAAATVAFQNANLSVSATDAFLEAVGSGGVLETRAVTTGEVLDRLDAGSVLDEIAGSAWACADPGMFFVDTANRWNTVPALGPIRSSNPCGEYLFPDDSACNLASLNLMKFRRPDGSFDVGRFRAAVRIFIVAQEILVGRASYPTAAIAENSHKYRPLGLGYCGLGALLMAAGLPYDSSAGRSLAGAVTALMTGEAYRTSADLAAHLGAFEGFAANRGPMLRVIAMHREAAYRGLDRADGEDHFAPWDDACRAWDAAQAAGERHGYRNAQATLTAPTGTIAFLMDSGHSTGLEPALALVQYKTLAGGGVLRIVNPVVPLALDALGYAPDVKQDILRHVEATDTIEGSGLRSGDLPVFDCAFPPAHGSRSISWRGHLEMVAAIQPFLSGASSKTINMPKDSTVADIRAAYLEAWRLGIKDIALYRDGCKEGQPVSTSAPPKEARPAPHPAPGPAPRRERLPDTRDSVTHKFSVGGVECYLTVGLFPDGRPGELFVTMAREGSTVSGLMDAWATMISIALQYGVPVDVLATKFRGGRFEPAGITGNRDIPFASSLVDYVVRWLATRFVPGYRAAHSPAAPVPAGSQPSANGHAPAGPPAALVAHAPLCPTCGGFCVPAGACWACTVCGSSTGCG